MRTAVLTAHACYVQVIRASGSTAASLAPMPPCFGLPVMKDSYFLCLVQAAAAAAAAVAVQRVVPARLHAGLPHWRQPGDGAGSHQVSAAATAVGHWQPCLVCAQVFGVPASCPHRLNMFNVVPAAHARVKGARCWTVA
jgi:hypothetical protein